MTPLQRFDRRERISEATLYLLVRRPLLQRGVGV
jgi:hypothetical protein